MWLTVIDEQRYVVFTLFYSTIVLDNENKELYSQRAKIVIDAKRKISYAVYRVRDKTG